MPDRHLHTGRWILAHWTSVIIVRLQTRVEQRIDRFRGNLRYAAASHDPPPLLLREIYGLWPQEAPSSCDKGIDGEIS